MSRPTGPQARWLGGVTAAAVALLAPTAMLALTTRRGRAPADDVGLSGAGPSPDLGRAWAAYDRSWPGAAYDRSWPAEA